MKKKKILPAVFIITLFFCFLTSTQAQQLPQLNKNYNLAGERTKEPQFFILTTTLIKYNLDGTRAGKDILKLYLKCSPEETEGENVYKYTCAKFSITSGSTPETTIPALKNWSYLFGKDRGYDEKGQVFGIDHAKFENLTDNNGQPIEPGISYWIYNSFIDFHGFCNTFAEPSPGGKGIQDLKRINDKIVHAAANSEPPVNLGTNVEEGSYFKNGEITLDFTGLSIVNNSVCAIVNFDSGESSFKMIMKPMPNMEITTIGSSHYKGNIYLNTQTFWVEKVVMDEFVLSETTVPGLPNKINSATERNTVIYNVEEEEFVKRADKI